MKPHILVVEDDDKARAKLAYRLEYAGYQVTQAASGEAALGFLEQETFQVVLTDMVMGSVDGIEVLSTARRMPSRPAVILLTGHGSLETCIRALRTGAYDYLLKPCAPEQLLACVEGAVQRQAAEQHLQQAAAVLSGAAGTSTPAETGPVPPRRAGRSAHLSPHLPHQRPEQVLRVGQLVVGSTRHEVTFGGEPVHLTPIEYALVFYLAERPEQVCHCSDIVQYTHGVITSDAEAQELLRTHLRNLRKKLSPSYLVNERGAGYALVDPDA